MDGPSAICLTVSGKVEALRQFLSESGGMIEMATNRVVDPVTLAKRMSDIMYLMDLVPDDVVQDDGFDFLVRSETGEEMNMKLVLGELSLQKMQPFLFDMAAEMLFNNYKRFTKRKPVVYRGPGAAHIESTWPTLLADKQMAVVQFMNHATEAVTAGTIGLALRRFGLEEVLKVTPVGCIDRVTSVLLWGATTSSSVVNFGGVSIDNCLRMTAARDESSFSLCCTNLTVANALWFSRKIVPQGDSRRVTATRQLYSWLASVKGLQSLTLHDVNLAWTTNDLLEWPQMGPHVEQEWLLEAAAKSVCPRISQVAFTGLRHLELTYSDWASNGGFSRYYGFLHWMLPLPSLKSLVLPEPGNLHGSHLVCFRRFLQEVTQLTSLRFHIAGTRQLHRPTCVDIATRMGACTQFTMNRNQRRRQAKKQKAKAGKGGAGTDAGTEYVIIRQMDQAEQWGVQLKQLTLLRCLTVWGSHALALIQWPWVSNLTSLELSIPGFAWEVDVHGRVLKQMTSLRRLDLYFGELEDTPDPPVCKPAASKPPAEAADHGDEDQHDSGHSGGSSSSGDDSAPMEVDGEEAHSVDVQSGGRPTLVDGLARCGWCNHGHILTSAVSVLCNLTRLKLWTWASGVCCVFNLSDLSSLLALTEFEFTMVRDGTQEKVDAWLKEGGNLILPKWPQLRRLWISAPVPLGVSDTWFDKVGAMTLLQELTLVVYWNALAMTELMKVLTEGPNADPLRMKALLLGDHRYHVYGETVVSDEVQKQQRQVFCAMMPALKAFKNLKSLRVPPGPLKEMMEAFGRPQEHANDLPFMKMDYLEELYVPGLTREEVSQLKTFKDMHDTPVDQHASWKTLNPDWVRAISFPPELRCLSLSVGSRVLPELALALGHLSKLQVLQLAFREGGTNSPGNVVPVIDALAQLSRLQCLSYVGGDIVADGGYVNVHTGRLPKYVQDAWARTLLSLSDHGNLLQLYMWGVVLRDFGDSSFPHALARVQSLKVLSLFGCDVSGDVVRQFTRVFDCGDKFTVRRLHLFHISMAMYGTMGKGGLQKFLQGFPCLTRATFGVKRVEGGPACGPRFLGSHRLDLKPRTRGRRLTDKLVDWIKKDFERAGVHGARVGHGMLREAYTDFPKVPTWDTEADQGMLDSVQEASEAAVRSVCPMHKLDSKDWLFEEQY